MNDPVKAADASDISAGDWIDRRLPAAFRPYARLSRIDRPIGTWLLLLPCWWGSALATASMIRPPELWHFALFAIGSLVMRGAGCAWNDILDRNFDGQVARTATRPIPSGAITVRQAALFLGALMLCGLAVLLTFNTTTVAVGAAALLLVAIYPLMKRVTYWPQALLGLTFNWGALVGWAAITGSLDAPALWLYAAGIAWTLGYDTIYAHQDKEDDVLIGVKSSALKLGDRTRPFLFLFYAITIGLLAMAGHSAGLSPRYFIVLALAAIHLIWQAWKVDIDDPENCLAKFKSNRIFGLILLLGIIAGAY
ncbi:MAG: 4-hydroxybenzoate octaprenyltransferase [Alphaproteobacteria bacterium]|nr:4-hydroxybenzoate octaprenyltransferase [Alphaproteobacteria bacterium]